MLSVLQAPLYGGGGVAGDLIAILCWHLNGTYSRLMLSLTVYILKPLHIPQSTNCTSQQLCDSLTAACVHVRYLGCVIPMNVTKYDTKTWCAALFSVKTQFCKQVSLSLSLSLFSAIRWENMILEKASSWEGWRGEQSEMCRTDSRGDCLFGHDDSVIGRRSARSRGSQPVFSQHFSSVCCSRLGHRRGPAAASPPPLAS